MDALEFALAVEFSFIHRNADLICLGLDLLIGRVQHGSGTDIDDLTNHIKSHHSPDARIMYKVTNGNQIDIMITTTDRTAGKDNDPEDYISTAPFGAFDYEYDDEFFYDDLDDVYFDDDFDFDW